MAMLSAGIVEHYRLTQAINDCKYSEGTSSWSRTLCLGNMTSATLRMSTVDILATGILKFAIVVFMASPCSTKTGVI
ncbi:hypothetical protein H5410_038735 [Solanum commersonii]|uniref:Uncharacterized protein n=1 Tax=Solanum commersonii TaxID=4109 RepID=A0A9J5YC84_SOLCO|nr:hypothetical protein H5410_038735 [Solanum commersonii]